MHCTDGAPKLYLFFAVIVLVFWDFIRKQVNFCKGREELAKLVSPRSVDIVMMTVPACGYWSSEIGLPIGAVSIIDKDVAEAAGVSLIMLRS